MKTFNHNSVMPMLVAVLVGLLCTAPLSPVQAQALYRAPADYEKTVRIVILWNEDPPDKCITFDVGKLQGPFVLKALDTTRVTQVKVLTYEDLYHIDDHAKWELIKSQFPDSLPHVIVDINSGWYHIAPKAILDSAVKNFVGVVSIGDDAAQFTDKVFGTTGTDNVPEPIYGAESLNIDTLKSTMYKDRDDQFKSLGYPHLNGIISNTYDSILFGGPLVFKPYGGPDGDPEINRCEQDADKFTVLPEYKPSMHFLADYQAHSALSGLTYPKPDVLHTIYAIQDTVNNVVRRGVALSMQPTYIQNKDAGYQLIYDAIMTSSQTKAIQPGPMLIQKAFYLDTNRDGQVDQVKIILNQAPEFFPDRYLLTLPAAGEDKERIIPATGTVSGSRKVITITLTTPYPAGITEIIGGTGIMYLIPGDTVFTKDLPFSIRDSVGPVVASVNVKKRDDIRTADTVTVVFSEEMSGIATTGNLVFPFEIKDKNGKIVSSTQLKVRQIIPHADGRTYSFVFDTTFAVLPINTGATLAIKDGAGVTDVRGNPSSPVPTVVVVEPIQRSTSITVSVGGIAKGATISDPRALATPVILVVPPLPPGVKEGVRPNWDANLANPIPLESKLATQLDPNDGVRKGFLRDASLPVGPVITVELKRLDGFSFDLNYYDHLGKFINSAKGAVSKASLQTTAMLSILNAIKKENTTNNYAIGLQWYPVDTEGNQVGSGVYIGKGTIRSLGNTTSNPDGSTTEIQSDVQQVYVKMGYVRWR